MRTVEQAVMLWPRTCQVLFANTCQLKPYTNAIHYARSTAPPHRRPSHLTTTHPIPARAPTSDPRSSNGLLFCSMFSWLCVPTPPHIPSTPGGWPTSRVPPVSKVLSVALPRSMSSRAKVLTNLPALLTAAGLVSRSSPSPAPPPRLLSIHCHACTRRQTTAR